MAVQYALPTRFDYLITPDGVTRFAFRHDFAAATGAWIARYGQEFITLLRGRPFFITSVVTHITTAAADERSTIVVYRGTTVTDHIGETMQTATESVETTYGPVGPFDAGGDPNRYLIAIVDEFGEWSVTAEGEVWTYGRIYPIAAPTETDPLYPPTPVTIEKANIWPWKR